jgi:hypothetical protein
MAAKFSLKKGEGFKALRFFVYLLHKISTNWRYDFAT